MTAVLMAASKADIMGADRKNHCVNRKAEQNHHKAALGFRGQPSPNGCDIAMTTISLLRVFVVVSKA